MTQEEIIYVVSKELKKIDSIDKVQYGKWIDSFFDLSTHYDMDLKIDLRGNFACLYTCERGSRVYEYKTSSMDDVVFYILDNLIYRRASEMTWDKYADKEKRSLHYNDEIRTYSQDQSELLYSLVSQKYNDWYHMGRNSLKM